ncbi:MAG: peptidoglycan-binding protein [Patescibacteria group bacterium]
MNTYKKLFVFVFGFIAFLGFAQSVSAMVPTLSISGNSNSGMLVTIVGDANASVVFYYPSNYGSYGLQSVFLGSTNNLGYFSTTLTANTYNISQGSLVYVLVNNQQSPSVTWSTSSYSNLSLSQTNVTLSAGQTSTVTASNSFGTLYVSNNSNSNVATATVSGNTVSIYGMNIGTTTVTICQNSGSSYCGMVYVTVSGSYNYNNGINTSGLIVSNLNLSVGNSITVSSMAGGNLYVSSNSNSNVAGVSSSGSAGCLAGAQYSVINGQPCYYIMNNNGAMTITALSSGVSTITLCQTNASTGCSTILVTVNGAGSVLGASTINTGCYISRTLRYGMSGTDVACLQSYLSAKGYLISGANYSAYFDMATRNAVTLFQRDHYLGADGVVGRMTREALYQ